MHCNLHGGGRSGWQVRGIQAPHLSTQPATFHSTSTNAAAVARLLLSPWSLSTMAGIKYRLSGLLREAGTAAGDGGPPFCCSAPLPRTTTQLDIPGLGYRLSLPLEETVVQLLKQLCVRSGPEGSRTWLLEPSKFGILNKSEPGGGRRGRGGQVGNRRRCSGGRPAEAGKRSPRPAASITALPRKSLHAEWEDTVDGALGTTRLLLDLGHTGRRG